MSEIKTSKGTGNLKIINVKYDDFLNIENLEVKNISTFIGTNGSGKTLLMIHAYVLASLAQLYLASGKKGGMIDLTTFLFKYCFEPFNWTGTCSGEFESGAKIEVTLENGVVTNAVALNFDDIEQVSGVVYMSTNLRKFDQLEIYLKMRRLACKTTDKTLSIEGMYAILQEYKHYDVMYVEQLINKLPLKIPNEIMKSLKENYDFTEDIDSVDVDLERDKFFVLLKDGSLKFLNTYGAGHQAIFNMMLGNLQ